ncbi:MAG: hypothetical protein CMH89_02370 [Oceanicaulis sp.]|jgi:hypothetical protein|nr:hypothetical protein [Oceanicaulis sp.]MBG35401.1 hypothetical protein [Oceanicaulis sp.]HCR95703.1 hypothetical protein [Oceanicaulis sp.]|tara:strand:- start:1813 stop:2169 length:357 start_codon:yes stop_codon:yes gene_type:complete
MRSILIIAAGSLFMTGCTMLPSSLSSDWQCPALGQSTCTDIASNDELMLEAGASGIVPASAALPSQNAQDRPVFYGRQVARVTLAPWVDQDGRFHAGEVIFAPYGLELWGAPREGEGA